MTPVTLFKFTYVPFVKGSIRSADFYIVAENRKEAELIALNKAYDFLDLDHTVEVTEVLQGFKE